MYKIKHNDLSLSRWLKIIIMVCVASLLSYGNANAQAPVTVQIGGTTTGNWFYGPIMRNAADAGTLNYSRHAYIYTASELGIPAGAKIVKLEWLKQNGSSITGNNKFNCWLANTTAATFASTVPWNTLESGSTQVYASTTYTIPTGNNVYIAAPFNLPPNDSFTYSGSNLQILCDWAKLGTVVGTTGVNFFVTSSVGKAIGIALATPLTPTTNLTSASWGNSRPTLRITYVPVPACQGVPTTGLASSSVAAPCPGSPFTLTIQNTIPGSGVTYVWQRSPVINFSSGVTNVGTSSTLTTTETASFYYRCIATCGASALSDTSSKVYVPLSPHYGCYCASTALSTADEEIFNFTFGSLNNSSNCSTTAPGAGSAAQLYSNYQAVPAPAVEKGSNVPFSIQIGTCLNFYPNRSAMFIDYNQNSVFEANELVYSTPSSVSGPHIETGTILIPSTALTGLTGLRIISSEQGAPIINPCLVYSWGETEDYLINITPTTICAGMPNPGNTLSNSPTVCSGKTVNLSIQNLTTGQGVTYQWYSNGTPINGATSFAYTTDPIYSATTFYCAVTCNTPGGSTANSNPIIITMSSFLNCYCTSGAGNDADEDIYDFTFNGKFIATDCINPAPGPGSILGRYSNFHTMNDGITERIFDTLFVGQQKVPFIIHSDDCDQAPYYSFGSSIWIDFNQNGSFSDPGEQVFSEPVAIAGPRYIDSILNRSGALNRAVPCDALEGKTGMRVTIAEGVAGANISPCLAYGFGETEDYIIYIKKPDTCGFTPSNKVGNVEASVKFICAGDSVISNLAIQNKCLFNTYTYQWYRDNVAIPGANSQTYTTPKLGNTTTYKLIATCNTNGVLTYDTAAPITILKITPNVTLTPAVGSPTSYCTGGIPVSLNANGTPPGAFTYTYSPNTSLTPVIGQHVDARPLSTTTYTVTGTESHGCFATATYTVETTSLPDVHITPSSNTYCFPTGNAVTITSTGLNATHFSYTPSTGLSPDSGSVVIATPNVTTTYILTASDSSGCSGVDSTTITVNPCSTILNLKLFIQGYYDALGYMKPVLFNEGIGSSTTVADSVKVELHYTTPPYSIAHEKTVILHTDGTAIADFPSIGGSYYIAVSHRNAVQTWSALPVNSNAGSYDFSSSASQAFGGNMIEVEPGIWAFYSGDINTDDNVDLLDLGTLETDINDFAFGYISTDINGDGNVDLLDVPVLELNVTNFIFASKP